MWRRRILQRSRDATNLLAAHSQRGRRVRALHGDRHETDLRLERLLILLRRFRPEYVGKEPPGINATVTLTPKGGLPFRIRELS